MVNWTPQELIVILTKDAKSKAERKRIKQMDGNQLIRTYVKKFDHPRRHAYGL